MTDSQFHLLTPFSNSSTIAGASPAWDDSGSKLTTHRHLVLRFTPSYAFMWCTGRTYLSVPLWNRTHLLYELVNGQIRKAVSLNSAYRPDVLTALCVILLSLSTKVLETQHHRFLVKSLRTAFSVAIRISLTRAHNLGSWNYEPRNE